MNWLIKVLALNKEARRRFNPNDKVRFFTDGRKGRGKGIVLTPQFQKGEVVDYRQDNKRYLVNDGSFIQEVHPRNIVHDSIPKTDAAPVITPLTPPTI